MTEEKKLTSLEGLKENSDYLRGRFKELLADDSTHMPQEETQLLKFHGSYQQDDRDQRKQLVKEKKEKAFSFMIRTRHSGGAVTPEQYLSFDKMAGELGNPTLRITTRQTFQFHGVFKKNLKELIRTVNEAECTTSGTCGDIVRNVLADPAPFESRKKIKLQEYAKAVSDQFLSQSGAYCDIWLDGEKMHLPVSEGDPEPIYGKTYLPRKFKIALTYSDINSIDALTNDIGIVAEVNEAEDLVGFNIFVGGGMGMSPSNPNTYPRLASALCFVPPEDLLEITKAIVLVQKEFGNRSDRKVARMKYLIDSKGLDWFRGEVEKQFGKKSEDAHPVDFKPIELYLGWNEEGDGKLFFGLSVENGRIKDDGDFRLKTALKGLVEKWKPQIYLTAQQDIIFSGFNEADKNEVEELFKSHGVQLPSEKSNVRKDSMACPALPLCGLALSESERALPGYIDQIETEISKLGLEDERIMIRMTGCPNGCARPYMAEIGFVGRGPTAYGLYLGGSIRGDRLNYLFKDRVPSDTIVSVVSSLLSFYKEDKNANENFGDFCCRVGQERLNAIVE